MTTIYLIRHAEKPTTTARGVRQNGAPDPESLIPRGWQRAGALAMYFASSQSVQVPNAIYASALTKHRTPQQAKAGSKSVRPLETITPLATKLGITPVKSFGKGVEPALVGAVERLKGTILICWQHEAIPEIGRLMMGKGAGIPKSWPANRFDVVWRFTRSRSKDPWVFHQICPMLLAGDKSHKIP